MANYPKHYFTDAKTMDVLDDFNFEAKLYDTKEIERLRTCSAEVGKVYDSKGNLLWLFLRSYSTITAIVDCYSGECYDLLRAVYGYTATSAQHFSKFSHDYSGYFSIIYRCDHDSKGYFYRRIR